MHDVEKRSAVVENAAGFARRHVCIRSHNNGGIGVCLYIGKQTLCSPEHCKSRNATGARFLEVQLSSCVLVYDWDP